MTQKKIPMRQCIGCGEMFPKRELIRVVKPKEGDVSLDMTGKLPGRGAYICRNRQSACDWRRRTAVWRKAFRAGSIRRFTR